MRRIPHRKRRPRLKVPMGKRHLSAYRQLWRLVDGEVRATFDVHPEYLRVSSEEKNVRNSITKRVVGRILSWASQKTGPGSIP